MVAAVGCYWVSGRDETWAPGANRQHGNSTDAQLSASSKQIFFLESFLLPFLLLASRLGYFSYETSSIKARMAVRKGGEMTTVVQIHGSKKEQGGAGGFWDGDVC